MAFSLRLPPGLDASARVRAGELGVTLNGLICVALDAYLNRSPVPLPLPLVEPVSQVEKVAPVLLASPVVQVEKIPAAASNLTRKQRRAFERSVRLG